MDHAAKKPVGFLHLLQGLQAAARNQAEIGAFLEGRLATNRALLGGVASRRFDECKDIMIGATKPFVQQPTLLNSNR